MTRFIHPSTATLCAVFIVLMHLMADAQVGADLTISVRLDGKEFPEHLPARFYVDVRNVSRADVEVEPYDTARLPRLILNISFDSPLKLSQGEPGIVDFGVPPVRIRASETLELPGYLQDYMSHLSPGAYVIPYAVQWEYRLSNRSRRRVNGAGKIEFRVVESNQQTRDDYIGSRVKTLRQETDARRVAAAARELTLVDHASVIPALTVLKDLGYHAEAIAALNRFQTREADEAVVDLLVSSNNPAITREAMAELEKRRVAIPERALRALLGSTNKWLQIEALKHVGRVARADVLDVVQALSLTKDADLRGIAEEVLKKLSKK